MREPFDHPAWREFDRRYGELIIRYCCNCGLQMSDAEDMRQAVLMSLARSLPSFEYQPRRGRFRDYLRRTTRNAVARHLQAHGKIVATVGRGPEWCDTNDDDPRWETAWVQHHYRLALQTLQRTTEAKSLHIFDRLLSGATVAEIAEVFSMTPDAVRRVRERIRDRLRGLIAAQIAAEEKL